LTGLGLPGAGDKHCGPRSDGDYRQRRNHSFPHKRRWPSFDRNCHLSALPQESRRLPVEH
jgi:hypothetical protein